MYLETIVAHCCRHLKHPTQTQKWASGSTDIEHKHTKACKRHDPGPNHRAAFGTGPAVFPNFRWVTLSNCFPELGAGDWPVFYPCNRSLSVPVPRDTWSAKPLCFLVVCSQLSNEANQRLLEPNSLHPSRLCACQL